MSGGHHHGHGHGYAGHHGTAGVSDSRLLFSIALNLGLSVVEVVVGLIAGSLALVADAVHNLNDAGALVIAYVARRIARRGADRRYTFGYRRAELIGAMINATTLGVVGLYLCYEAIERLLAPTPVATGWVMITAAVALAVDVFTALFLWALSRGSLNVRAAFVHNLTDAAASLAVLVGAGAIALFGWTFVDPLITLAIALYVLYAALSLLRSSAHILMEGTPPHLDLDEVAAALATEPGVLEVHHLHAWELDEAHTALEAHVTLDGSVAIGDLAELKRALKEVLLTRYGVEHSTLEFEVEGEECGPAHTPGEPARCRA